MTRPSVTMPLSLLLALALLAGLPACEGDEGGGGGSTLADGGPGVVDGASGDGGGLTTVPALSGFTKDRPASCTGAGAWTGGNRESPLMRPGLACIACHASGGEGPRYAIAGTVFNHGHEKDDCFGVAQAIVEVTDATGRRWRMRTNRAGNFYASPAGVTGLKMPITARVIRGNRARAMTTKVSTGDCNTCHTVGGTNSAPGRILAP